MFSLTTILNRILILRYKSYFRKYQKSLQGIERVQSQKLKSYLKKNAHTAFGKDHNFSSIKNYQSFIKNVPITEYEDYQSYLQKIKTGQNHVLTFESPICVEPTSGSSTSPKFIPYTQTLLKEFEMGIGVWIFKLFKLAPKTFNGKQYWVTTPPLRRNFEFGNIRVGLNNDTEYLSKMGRIIMTKTMSINNSLTKFNDSDDFFKETLIALLNDENLSFISAWSPSFLLQMDSFLRENYNLIVSGISNSQRRSELLRLGEKSTWKEYWKNLEIVSCWTDASSVIWKKSLVKSLGKSVKIQPKGLLATEGITTIPIDIKGTHVLSVLSHFYEFKLLDNSVVRAHELKNHDIATVIITTGGGLYRYNTHDLVKVNNVKDGICELTFLGRDNNTSDLVGEKLNEQHVVELLEVINESIGIEINCFIIEGIIEEKSAYYLAHIEANISIDTSELNKIQTLSEEVLRKNIYYDQAIKSGQLKSIKVQLEQKGFNQKLLKNYSKYHNIKFGDIKLPLLFDMGELNKISYGN